MSEYMMGFALLGAVLLSAPAVMADYDEFALWRGYDLEGYEVVTLVTLGRVYTNFSA